MNQSTIEQSNEPLTNEQAQLLITAYHDQIYWWDYQGALAPLQTNINVLLEMELIQETAHNTWGITAQGEFWLQRHGYVNDPILSKLVNLITPTCDLCGECDDSVVTLDSGMNICLYCADEDYSGDMICQAVH